MSSAGTYPIDGFEKQPLAPFKPSPYAQQKKTNLQTNPLGTAHSSPSEPQEVVQYHRQIPTKSSHVDSKVKTDPEDQFVTSESKQSTSSPSFEAVETRPKVPQVQVNPPNFQEFIRNPILSRMKVSRRPPFRPTSGNVIAESKISEFIHVAGTTGTPRDNSFSIHEAASAPINTKKKAESKTSKADNSYDSRPQNSNAQQPAEPTAQIAKSRTRPSASGIQARARTKPNAQPTLARLPVVTRAANPPTRSARLQVNTTQSERSHHPISGESDKFLRLATADETIQAKRSESQTKVAKSVAYVSAREPSHANQAGPQPIKKSAEAEEAGSQHVSPSKPSFEVEKRSSGRPELAVPTVAPAVALRDQAGHSSRRQYIQYESEVSHRSTIRHATVPSSNLDPTECSSCNRRILRHQLTAPPPSANSARVDTTVNSEAESVPQDLARSNRQPNAERPVLRPVSRTAQPNPHEVAPSPSDVSTEREPLRTENAAPTIVPDQQPNPFEDEAATNETQEPVPDPAFAYEQPVVESQFDDDFGWSSDCGFGCPPGWYAIAEAFWARREGEANASLSNDIRLNSFNYQLAGRITVGRKYDCLNGWEASFVGPLQYQVTGFAAGNSVNSKLRPAGGINLSAFNGAATHFQSYKSQLMSAELNQKWWGWDVISTSWGLRYLRLDEEFILRATQANGDTGLFDLDATTDLIGPQVGLDMIFPIGRWTFSSKTKLAALVSAAHTRTRVVNAGVVQIDNGDRQYELGALVEVGFRAKRRILPRVQLSVGYDFWYIYGVAIATEQTISPVTPTTGSRFMDPYGDIFVHGATAGIEAVW